MRTRGKRSALLCGWIVSASDRFAGARDRLGNLDRRFGWVFGGLVLGDEDADGLGSPLSHPAITHQSVDDRPEALHVRSCRPRQVVGYGSARSLRRPELAPRGQSPLHLVPHRVSAQLDDRRKQSELGNCDRATLGSELAPVQF